MLRITNVEKTRDITGQQEAYFLYTETEKTYYLSYHYKNSPCGCDLMEGRENSRLWRNNIIFSLEDQFVLYARALFSNFEEYEKLLTRKMGV